MGFPKGYFARIYENPKANVISQNSMGFFAKFSYQQTSFVIFRITEALFTSFWDFFFVFSFSRKQLVG